MTTYTEKEWDEFLRMYSGLSDKDVADGLCVSRQAVQQQRAKRGLPSSDPKKPYRDWSQEPDLFVGTCAEAARRYGVSAPAIHQARRRHGGAA